METKQDERLHARNLYFGTNMSQQEIADQCNSNRKTLYLWINEGGWRHAKYAAAHAPALLLDQYYEQLGKLNQHIATRENPWPTKDEATTIRKITMSINHFKESTSLAPTMQIFHDFIKYLQLNENKWDMAKEFALPIDRFVKKMMEDKKWLTYNFNTINNEEQHFLREYAEWLKTPKDEEPKETTPQPENVILNSSKDQPGNHTPAPPERSGEVAKLLKNEPVPTAQPNLSADKHEPVPEPNLPPSKPRPLTYEEVKQKMEVIRLSKQASASAQSQPGLNSQSPNCPLTDMVHNSNQQTPPANNVIPDLPRGGAITYSPGTPPKGTPVAHPTQPRHLTTIDIQKMMETPHQGQTQNNFNPKRY